MYNAMESPSEADALMYQSTRQLKPTGGFSLVELSIVLVIIGLLVGGILAGRSLIRASELRAVGSEYQRYLTASNAFRDKYFALPGDMTNATQFWGRLNSNADCVTNSSPATAVATPGACDGNGNRLVLASAAASQSGEIFQYWRHLANAGLIEGSYTGIAGSGGASHAVGGENAPISRLNPGIWATYTWGDTSADLNLFDSSYGNALRMGGASTGAAPNNNLVKPEEMWNVDKKLDDGMPALGKILVRSRVTCAVAADGTALTTSAGDAAKLDAIYNLSNATTQCAFVFRQAY